MDDLAGVWFLFEALLRHQSEQDERMCNIEKVAVEWHEQALDAYAMAGFSLEAGRHREAALSQRVATLEAAACSSDGDCPGKTPDGGWRQPVLGLDEYERRLQACIHQDTEQGTQQWLPSTYWTHECARCGIVEPLHPTVGGG